MLGTLTKKTPLKETSNTLSVPPVVINKQAYGKRNSTAVQEIKTINKKEKKFESLFNFDSDMESAFASGTEF